MSENPFSIAYRWSPVIVIFFIVILGSISNIPIQTIALLVLAFLLIPVLLLLVATIVHFSQWIFSKKYRYEHSKGQDWNYVLSFDRYLETIRGVTLIFVIICIIFLLIHIFE